MEMENSIGIGLKTKIIHARTINSRYFCIQFTKVYREGTPKIVSNLT